MTEINSDADADVLKSIDKNIKGIIVSLWGDAYKKLDESHNILKLLKQANDLQLKTIIDLDPTTTDLWFADSEINRSGNYSDYYIWRPAKIVNDDRDPPTNWVRLILALLVLNFYFILDLYLIFSYLLNLTRRNPKQQLSFPCSFLDKNDNGVVYVFYLKI